MAYNAPRLSGKQAYVLKPVLIHSPNTLYIVQEAWGQPHMSSNLYDIARSLYQSNGVSDFFAEGVFDPMSADYIRTSGRTIADKDAAFMQGKIKPVEYLALMSEDSFDIHPADKQDLYDDNQGAYFATVKMEKYARKALAAMEKILKRFSSRSFSKDWEMIKELKLKRAAGKPIDMSKYLTTLLDFADKNQIDYSGLPAIVLLRMMISEENQLDKDHKRAEQEMAEIMKILFSLLEEKDPGEALLTDVLTFQFSREKKNPDQIQYADFSDLHAAYERGRQHLLAELKYALRTAKGSSEDQSYVSRIVIDMAMALRVDITPFPNARKYILTMQRLDTFIKQSDTLFRSIDHLADTILRSHPQGGGLWRSYLLHRDLLLINKLFKSRLEHDDLKHVERIRTAYRFKRVMEALTSAGADPGEIRTLEEYAGIWDRGLDRAIRFYDYAALRREFMAEQIKLFFGRGEKRSAAIFLGGFHSKSLQRDLSRQGVCSSVIITPHLSGKLSPVDLYKQIMLSQK